MLSSEKVKQWARECGADVVGIGDMARFEGAPKQSDPRYIFPEAKTMVGLAFRVHRGLYRGIEEGTWFAGLPSMGYANINDVFAPIVLRGVGDLLEDNGYEAVLYQNTSVRYGCGIGEPVADGLPRPDVFLHFRIAAFICGMGEIGYSKVFLTPEFGPRQRFAFIITDAPLEPDPIYDGPQLCDQCQRCVAECPGNAIGGDETVKVTIGAIEETRKPRKPRLEKLGSRVVTGSPKGGAFLGVRLHDPDENLASYFDFPDEGGALVLGTEEESPAGEAGIVGGDVIIRFGDEKIGDSHDLVRIVGESEAGDEIELFLIRKGKKKKVRVTLGEGEARSWVRRHTGQFRELDLEKLRPFGNRLEEDMEQLKKELIELKRELMRMKKER